MNGDDKKLKLLYFERCRTALERRRVDQGEVWSKPRVSREAEDIYRKSIEGTGSRQLLGVLSDYWTPIHYPRRRRNKKTVLVRNTGDEKTDSTHQKPFESENTQQKVVEECTIAGPSREQQCPTPIVDEHAPSNSFSSTTDGSGRIKTRDNAVPHRTKAAGSSDDLAENPCAPPSRPSSSQRSMSQPRSHCKTFSSKCPSISKSNDHNYRLLPNNDRLKVLLKLQSAETEITQKLNKLPIRTDTKFLIRRKDELNHRLLEIDKNRELFSRPKVYVLEDAGSPEHLV